MLKINDKNISKIAIAGNEFAFDGKSLIGKQAVVKSGTRITDLIEYSRYIDGGKPKFDTDYWSQDYITKITHTLSIDGVPYIQCGNDASGWRVYSVFDILKNGGVLSSALAHIYQCFRAFTSRLAVSAL